MKLTDPKTLYRLEWSPDGKVVKEVYFSEGKPISMVRWKMNQLRQSTHKAGILIPVPVQQK